MVQDPAFRDRVRQMAEAGAREKDSFDREAGKDFAAKIAEHATPAVEAGIDPESPEAGQIVDRIVADRAGRAQVAEQLATFADGRVDRYWHLVGVINSWPPFPSAFKSYEWVIEALRAHG